MPRKGQLTKQKILETATTLFAEHGFGGTSIDDLVEVAELAKGTFYKYFPSKDALILEIFDGFERDMSSKLDSGDQETLASLVAAFAHLRVAHKKVWSVLIGFQDQSALSRKAKLVYQRAVFGLARKIEKLANCSHEQSDWAAALIDQAITLKLHVEERVVDGAFIKRLEKSVLALTKLS